MHNTALKLFLPWTLKDLKRRKVHLLYVPFMAFFLMDPNLKPTIRLKNSVKLVWWFSSWRRMVAHWALGSLTPSGPPTPPGFKSCHIVELHYMFGWFRWLRSIAQCSQCWRCHDVENVDNIDNVDNNEKDHRRWRYRRRPVIGPRSNPHGPGGRLQW